MQFLLGTFLFLNILRLQPILMPIPEEDVVFLPKKSAPKIVFLSFYDIFGEKMEDEEDLLFKAEIDLSKRWHNKSTNDGFRDNILLGLYYLDGGDDIPLKNPNIVNSGSIDWEGLQGDFEISFDLLPGEVFAFHKNVLDDYEDKSLKTMGSEFVTNQGYKVVSGLGGNGVCHLASLITWAATEADLSVTAKADHSFAKIEGVPREYWTSIRYLKNGGNSKNQNLYVVNNKDYGVKFVFTKKGNILSLKIIKKRA
jgi:hypothetical protein